MTKVVTPSIITNGQIGKLCDLLTAALRKSGLPGEAVQQVVEQQGDLLIGELVTAIRKRVETISSMIVRRVRPNRLRLPQTALAATGRKQYVTDDVVATMPRGEGDEAEVIFFKLDLKDGWISDDKLDEEYALRGLKPTDPYSLAAVNEADPAFADERPNCTHWKDAQGKWCYAAFLRWNGERRVDVLRYGDDWDDYWWFAGSRK